MNTERYRQLFINRPDAYGQQQEDGRWRCIKEPITPSVIEAHLLGEITCGWYAIGQDGKARWACLDADAADGLKYLQSLCSRLYQLGLAAYLEESREGRGHLWLFTEPVAPKTLRRLLSQLVERPDTEIFPKQDAVSEQGYGSMVRGPLGIHRKTGARYGFVYPGTLEKVGGNLREQLEYLDEVVVVDGVTIAEALAEVLDASREQARADVVYQGEDINDIDLVAVAREFTELEDRGHYYLGLCPLHPEQHHSFAVYPNPGGKPRWFCFHDYQGGDAVSLYAKMKGLSYREALKQLREKAGDRL